MSKEYYCKLSKSGQCRYGGNKNYNYGFAWGNASFCNKAKRFISNMDKCPLIPDMVEDTFQDDMVDYEPD